MATEIPGDEAYDPCAAYIRLRDAYHNVLTGETVRRVRIRNGEEERETDFAPGNIGALKEAMNQAQRECIAKTTGRPARSAIGIGYRGPIRGVY